MNVASRTAVEQLSLDTIDRITFYKRDELTTDLICCDIVIGAEILVFHEEDPSWPALIGRLEQLPRFKRDWFAGVSTPSFQRCATIAFARESGAAA